jgi:ACS family hexuronate transporter-like MFS transporter
LDRTGSYRGFSFAVVFWSLAEMAHAFARSVTGFGASWAHLLTSRQVWAIAIGKFLTDPVWFLYLFWIPDFLNKTRGLGLLNLGLPLVVIYLSSDVGSVSGGWLSGALIRRGWSVIAARKTAMLVCASGVVPILFAVRASSLGMAVGLVALAAACHQGWSANIYTLVSDMFPGREVGSVVGIAGMAGAGGSMLIAEVVSHILQATGSYYSIFAIASCTYLVALGIIQVMVGKADGPANSPKGGS